MSSKIKSPTWEAKPELPWTPFCVFFVSCACLVLFPPTLFSLWKGHLEGKRSTILTKKSWVENGEKKRTGTEPLGPKKGRETPTYSNTPPPRPAKWLPTYSMTFFRADFGKEFTSRTLWTGPSWNCPSPRSVLCPLLYRREHFSRGRTGRKGAQKRGRKRGGQQRRQKGKKDAWKQVSKFDDNFLFRERKMRTKFFLHKLFEHRQGSGTSRQNSRDIPDSSLRNPRKTKFRGRARSFRPPPLRVEDPHPTGRSPDPKT